MQGWAMSAILQLKNILFTQSTKPLFRGFNLAISRGDRIGLVGHNGSGKSTLFSLLSKQLTPDEGEIIHPRGLQFGLVEQFIPENLSDQSLEQAVLEARQLSFGPAGAEPRRDQRRRCQGSG